MKNYPDVPTVDELVRPTGLPKTRVIMYRQAIMRILKTAKELGRFSIPRHPSLLEKGLGLHGPGPFLSRASFFPLALIFVRSDLSRKDCEEARIVTVRDQLSTP